MGIVKSYLRWCVLLLLPGCLPLIEVREEREFSTEAIEACLDFCHGSFRLQFRNDQTSFCECFNESGGFVGSIVVGNLGTLYR